MPPNCGRSRPKVLVVGLARTADEIEQIQRLRYDVHRGYGRGLSDAQDGVEHDRFDPFWNI